MSSDIKNTTITKHYDALGCVKLDGAAGSNGLT